MANAPWRIVATYRDDDGDPKEQFVHHHAGLDGMGGSSYIDTVILRDKDADTAWETTSDGTLEERVYHCQNWRADVVALVDDAGELVEQVRYSAYGIPFGMFSGDVDSDGDVDSNDVTQVNTWTSGYEVRGDLDLDDDVDSRDETIATNNQSKDLGWGLLSYVGGRTSLAGYQLDPTFAAVARMAHVRHRVLNADLGRWSRRDPLQYVDLANLYEYGRTNPTRHVDRTGHAATPLLRLQPADPCDVNCDQCQARDHPGVIPMEDGRWTNECPGIAPGPWSETTCCVSRCTHPPPDAEAYGGVRCCGGKRVICICVDEEIVPAFPNPTARGIATSCIYVHEVVHYLQMDCACGQNCVTASCDECAAYLAELACFFLHCVIPGRCLACGGDPQCEQEMLDYYQDILDGIEAECGACNAGFNQSDLQ